MEEVTTWYTDEANEERAVLSVVIERENHPYRKRVLQRLRGRIDGQGGESAALQGVRERLSDFAATIRLENAAHDLRSIAQRLQGTSGVSAWDIGELRRIADLLDDS